MPTHELKPCSRCNTTIECKVGDVNNCQCSNIQLSYEEKVFIEDKFEDCLCINCLHILKYQYQYLKSKNKLM